MDTRLRYIIKMGIHISIKNVSAKSDGYIIKLQEKCKLANIVNNNDFFSSFENNLDFMAMSKSNLVIS